MPANRIALGIVEGLLDDPNYEPSVAEMEYWGPLHDKLVARLRAPLALSKEDAQAWGKLVNECTGISNTGRAILAVDKLLRQRVTPLTDAQIDQLTSDNTPDDFVDWNQMHVRKLARAVEAAHGIGGEA